MGETRGVEEGHGRASDRAGVGVRECADVGGAGVHAHGTVGEVGAAVAAGAAGAGQRAGPHAGPGVRVSTIIADRICTKCPFNLAGQPVYREPHYGMLITVCPECGTAVALQEYPQLGRWSRRGVMVLAAAWFVGLIATALGSGAALFGAAYGLTAITSESVGLVIAQAHQEYHRAQMELAGPATQTTAWYASQPVSAYVPTDPTFIKNADWPSLMVRADVWGIVTQWRMLARVGMAWVLAGVIGVVWALLLPHLRTRGRLLLMTPAIGVIAALCLWLAMPADLDTVATAWGWYTAQSAAMQKIYWPWAFWLCAALLPALMVGLSAGRAIGRGVVRVLLPPRLREPLDFLWLNDGLAPPIGGGGRNGQSRT